MSQYRTDEINECVNRLYDVGARGDSNCYLGLSISDEENLVSLLMQATPVSELPSVHSLDLHGGIPLMIARFIGHSDVHNAENLSNYIKQLYMDYFKDKVKVLMEEKANERKLVQRAEARK